MLSRLVSHREVRLVSHREVRLVKHYRRVALNGLPPRVPIAATSTIQLVPLQVSRMCSGACLARSVQVMARP